MPTEARMSSQTPTRGKNGQSKAFGWQAWAIKCPPETRLSSNNGYIRARKKEVPCLLICSLSGGLVVVGVDVL